MTVVFLGVGQCGSQVLASYLNKSTEIERNFSYLTDEIKQFRSVLIDSEPKSCKYILEHSKLRVDLCKGLCLIHSFAGGTGSGLGTRLLQEIQDEIKLQLRLTFSIVPHKYGESPLQVYNYLLSLAGLLSSVDMINLVQNDWLYAQLEKRSSSSSSSSSQIARMEPQSTDIHIHDINNLITEQMTNLLSPTTSLSADDRESHRINVAPFEFCRNLTPLPEAKLVRFVSLGPQRNMEPHSEWSNLVEQLEPTLRCCPIDATWNLNKPNRRTGCRPLGTLTALVVYRTNNKHSFSEATSLIPKRDGRWIIDQSSSVSGTKFSHCLRPLAWNEAPLEQWFDCHSVNPPKSLTLAFNSCCITEDLECLVFRATMKRKAKAYLHWYTKFGCEENDFDQATEQIKQTIEGYNTLGK